MSEWKDGLIQTGVDKLMQYLKKEKEVGVDEAAGSLGVDKETVINWAKSLEESGLAEMEYTASRGRVLRLVGDTEKQQEKLETVRDDVSETVDKITRITREKARLDRFEEVLERMEQRLESDETAVEELEDTFADDSETLEELESYLDDLETVEDDLAELEAHIDAVKRDIDVLSTLEDHAADVAADTEDDDSGGVLSRLAAAIPFVGGSTASAAEEGETFKCDQCERVFDTERGLKTHRGMVHRNDETSGNLGEQEAAAADRDGGERD